MTAITLEIIGYAMVFLVAYVFFGYPVILYVMNLLTKSNMTVQDGQFEPTVTFIISCYNEEGVIKDKLNNALGMDYPSDKIEILVVSDGSTDQTDAIVSSFDAPRISLLRMEERMGKTIGLNHAVDQAKGQIIVFSDANAMYEKNAIRMLVRHFVDPKTGYVVGEARYRKTNDGASISERSYWAYECAIKKIESKLHSVVGGDGAIYAIRRNLYEPLLETDINDFVNPLQIIAKGYRGIFEPEAVCWEDTAGSFDKEYSRKKRIVNRSFSGLLRVSSVMNPFKSGLFSFEIVSHKLLRWLCPFFLITLMSVSMPLAALGDVFFTSILGIGLAIIILAYLGYLMPVLLSNFVFYYPHYFVSMNIASMNGVLMRLGGHTQVMWNTARSSEMGVRFSGKGPGRQIIHVAMAVTVLVCVVAIVSGHTTGSLFLFFVKLIFGLSFFVLMYIYAGYPLVLQAWSLMARKPVRKKDITPSVALLVCAYNEEEFIAEKIENSLAINYPKDKLRIVIASDGSSERTNEIIKSYNDPRIHFIPYGERSGKIGAIIKTMPAIDSDIVVFSDANTMINEDSVRHIVRNFHDPSVGAVSTDVVVLNSETSYGRSESLYYKYERWIQKMESDIGSIVGVDGGLYAIRRELYVEPSTDIILDDFVISMNTAIGGTRLVYEENAIGYEESSHSYKTEFSKKSRVVAGGFQALIKKEGLPPQYRFQLVFCYVSHKLLRWFTPFFLIMLYLSSWILTIKTGNGYVAILTLLQTLFYAVGYVGTWFRGPIKSPYIYIPFYFSLVNAAALLGFFKGILNKQSVKWEVFNRKQGDA